MEKVFINMDDIINKVAKTLIRASSTFREDQKDVYRLNIEKESNISAKWVLSQVIENALVAETMCSPLCDDTGIPHLFLEIGCGRTITAELLNSIQEGVKKGLSLLPGRPMAIDGDDTRRIDQSGGINPDPSVLSPAPFLIKPVKEDILRLTILMLGGGPAIRGITQRIFHKHSVSTVVDEIVHRSIEAVSKLGCSPCTLAVGIGRSQYEATSLMVEAMVYGDYSQQTDFEKEITNRVNQSKIGPLGLGGDCSVLATFAKIGPQRASGVRIVAIRPCCCVEPRKASIEL